MLTKFYPAKEVNVNGATLPKDKVAVTIEHPDGSKVDDIVRGLNNGFFTQDEPKKAKEVPAPAADASKK